MSVRCVWGIKKLAWAGKHVCLESEEREWIKDGARTQRALMNHVEGQDPIHEVPRGIVDGK